jgi:hypothetical protein
MELSKKFWLPESTFPRMNSRRYYWNLRREFSMCDLGIIGTSFISALLFLHFRSGSFQQKVELAFLRVAEQFLHSVQDDILISFPDSV